MVLGPTYIAIRSGKHSSSTAISHAKDFFHLLELEEFKNVMKTADSQVKLIFRVRFDGGTDENPRFQKTIDRFRYFDNRQGLLLPEY